ncbi:hypothetical protein, partial [Microbacterium sp. AISO3]|uniref:hypothetical protein n=1 Tax=Microbacterium sp. AISO3 TaxID=2002831 RepID=UPI0018D288BC
LDSEDASSLTADEGLSLVGDEELNLSDDLSESLSLGDDLQNDHGLSLGLDESESFSLDSESDFSDDAKKKLEEIDAIMDEDASRTNMNLDQLGNLDEPLVSDDLDLDSLNFTNEAEEVEVSPPQPK